MNELLLPLLLSAALFSPAGASTAIAPDYAMTPVQPPPSEAIIFPPVVAHQGNFDCPVTGDEVCRVRSVPPAAVLRRHLAAKENIWRDGDTLTFVYQGEQEAVELSGGLQYPMARLPGTDLWSITLRVPHLDDAFVTYGFFPTRDGKPVERTFASQEWRGPKAPAPMDKVKDLAGRIHHRQIASEAMKMARDLVIYEPPARQGEPLAGSVYVADGGSVQTLARSVEPLIVNGTLPRLLLVGLVSSPTSEGRMHEYLSLPGRPDRENATFLAHESFVVNEALPMVEKEFVVPRQATRRATFGFSNGAAWAIDMGLRHPELFGHVLGFSPAGHSAKLFTPLSATPPDFYLLGGLFEKPFRDKAIAWNEIFTSQHLRSTLRQPAGGHDFAVWTAYFPDALRWAFVTPRANLKP